MSRNSGWAVDNVFEAHAESVMVVTVEIKERELSPFKIKAF